MMSMDSTHIYITRHFYFECWILHTLKTRSRIALINIFRHITRLNPKILKEFYEHNNIPTKKKSDTKIHGFKPGLWSWCQNCII